MNNRDTSTIGIPLWVENRERVRFLCFKTWFENPNLSLDEIAAVCNTGKTTVSAAISYGLKRKWGKILIAE